MANCRKVNILERSNVSKSSLVASSVSRESACNLQETWVQFLGWRDPLEKEMTTHSRILAWRIPWAEEPGRLQSVGLQESDMI